MAAASSPVACGMEGNSMLIDITVTGAFGKALEWQVAGRIGWWCTVAAGGSDLKHIIRFHAGPVCAGRTHPSGPRRSTRASE
jgi:hypothetical protein